MELLGERTIAASRAEVWAALNDPEILQAAIPGCSDMTGNATDGYEAVVTQKIGPVKATFKGAVTLSDIVEATSYRIAGEGKGGAAGFASGAADVVLEDTAEGETLLRYTVEAKVGGKLARLGARLVDGVAKKLADKFFTNFEEALIRPKGAEGPETDGAEQAAE